VQEHICTDDVRTHKNKILPVVLCGCEIVSRARGGTLAYSVPEQGAQAFEANKK